MIVLPLSYPLYLPPPLDEKVIMHAKSKFRQEGDLVVSINEEIQALHKQARAHEELIMLKVRIPRQTCRTF